MFFNILMYLIYIYTHTHRGENNTWSSEMTKHICYLIGHEFSQFQALSGHFAKKKLKII